MPSSRTTRTTLAAAALLCLPTLVGACAAEEAEPSTKATESAVGSCGDYPDNPACNEPFFLQRAWELAQADAWDAAALPAARAAACVTGLVGMGAAVAGSGGAPPAAVGIGKVAAAIGVLDACKRTAEYLASTGLPANLSCAFQPVLYDPGVHLCECVSQCQGGVRNSGQWGDYSPPRAFRYGYLDEWGTSNCYCTDDLKEKTCRRHCADGYASPSVTDCTCR